MRYFNSKDNKKANDEATNNEKKNCNSDAMCNKKVHRIDNKIYFYAEHIDHEAQLAMIKCLEEAQSEIFMENAYAILTGEYQGCIEIHICSYGGYLAAGFAIHDYIRQMKIKTVGFVEGVAMSAASLILLACDERHMGDNSVVLIHQLSGFMIGTYDNMTDEKINVDKAMDKLRNIYLDETSIGMTEDMHLALMDVDPDSEDFDVMFDEFKTERVKALNELLSHDLELSKEECEEYGIVDTAGDEVQLTEEDNEKINKYIQEVAKSRLKKNKGISDKKKDDEPNKKKKKAK